MRPIYKIINSGDELNYYSYKLFSMDIYVIGDEYLLKSVLVNPENVLVDNIREKLIKKENSIIKKAKDFIDNYKDKKLLPVDYFDFSLFTESQKKVYKTLLKSKFGQLLSYKELAALSGFPGASRFVGTTMSKNLFPILIPCHRVIKSDGSIGNYTGGIEIKKVLLDFEKGTKGLDI